MINKVSGNDEPLMNLIKSFRLGFYDYDFRFSHNGEYIFFLFSDIESIRQLRFAVQNSSYQPKITVFLMPKLTEIVSAFLLEDEMFYYPEAELDLLGIGNVSKRADKKELFAIKPFGFDIIPLENDLVSMFSFNFIPRCWSFHDLCVISDIKGPLEVLKSNYGGFASVTAIGDMSINISKSFKDIAPSSLSHLIIIDRTIDLVTPLLSQSGYEGMIAELIGINCGIVSGLSESETSDTKEDYFMMESEDKLLPELRLLNYIELDSALKSIFKSITDRSSTKMSDDVTNLKGQFSEDSAFYIKHKKINTHIVMHSTLSNKIRQNRWRKRIIAMEAKVVSGNTSPMELITEMIMCGADFHNIIRLLCLDYVVNGRVEDYEKLVQGIYANYGLQQIPFILRLQHIGLFGSKNIPKTIFKQHLDAFKLISQDWVEKSDDAASLYLGYVPLSARIVEKICKGESQNVVNQLQKTEIKMEQTGRFMTFPDTNILICFIGGCTHSEINIIRRIGKKMNINFGFFTTRLFTPNEFFDDISYGIPGWSKVIQP